LDTTNTFRQSIKPYQEGYYSQVYSIKDAIRAGADAVVTYLVVGYGSDGVEGYNLTTLSNLRREAEDYGIPFIIEPLFVTKESYDSIRDVNLVKYVTRFASEIGADILKVDYTGSKETFRQVVEVAFSPILIRGGPKTRNDVEFLQMIKDSIDAGAKGVTVGRNLWQSANPEKLARAISLIVHEGKDVGESLKALE
ncbi:MAG: aldolase, partial [Sulfolobaceae archaeon]